MSANKYGIEVGQIYLAADGSKAGHIVTDVTTFADCDDVVTTPFSASAMGKPGNRIDAFKLAMVRYSLADKAPSWFPRETVPVTDKPLAAPGLISYRCKGRYGWIMIGANDDLDALKEARRSSSEAKAEDLQVWDGKSYVDCQLNEPDENQAFATNRPRSL